jgi:hypothetical protein
MLPVNHYQPAMGAHQPHSGTPPVSGQSKRGMSREDSFDDSYPRAKRGRSKARMPLSPPAAA